LVFGGAFLPEHILFEDVIEPGATWSHVLKRGTALRITDPSGGANVGAMFFNFECTAERLNIPDSLKAQHIGRLTTGDVLYSDMGRIRISIIGDTLGWHDPLGGHCTVATVLQKYGPATYQDCRNSYHRNARDGFLVELSKWGLGPADLSPNINFFSKVVVNENGDMSFVTGHSKSGSHVDLRAEMHVLTILNTCRHPMDPNPEYAPKRVELTVMRVDPPGLDDICRISRPENQRGFVLTERYFM
jgi:urea carboxylase-associated protein 2